MEWFPYQQKASATESYIINVDSRQRAHIESSPSHFRAWSPDSSELLVTRIESKELVMMAVNAKTGAIRQLFREPTRTFFDPSVTAPYSPKPGPATSKQAISLAFGTRRLE